MINLINLANETKAINLKFTPSVDAVMELLPTTTYAGIDTTYNQTIHSDKHTITPNFKLEDEDIADRFSVLTVLKSKTTGAEMIVFRDTHKQCIFLLPNNNYITSLLNNIDNLTVKATVITEVLGEMDITNKTDSVTFLTQYTSDSNTSISSNVYPDATYDLTDAQATISQVFALGSAEDVLGAGAVVPTSIQAFTEIGRVEEIAKSTYSTNNILINIKF